MTAKPKRPSGKTIRGADSSHLEQELSRCRRILKNTRAQPLTVIYFRRRLEMIKAELGGRS